MKLAIINVNKYRKYNNPVLSAGKAIGLTAGFVSILTLESTMLTTFNDGSMDLLTRRLFLTFGGGAISVLIITMAIYMIVISTKQIKEIRIWSFEDILAFHADPFLTEREWSRRPDPLQREPGAQRRALYYGLKEQGRFKVY